MIPGSYRWLDKITPFYNKWTNGARGMGLLSLWLLVITLYLGFIQGSLWIRMPTSFVLGIVIARWTFALAEAHCKKMKEKYEAKYKKD